MSHKAIMVKAARALSKDAKKYAREEKSEKKRGAIKAMKHHKIEEKEAKSAAKSLRKRALHAHE